MTTTAQAGRGAETTALAGTLTAGAALGYAQFMLPEQTLVSDYALVPGGLPPILIGMLALAAACLSLSYGLAAREPARAAATRLLLLAAAAGLMLSAVFPTDPGTQDVGSMAGEIHRWASAIVFTALPVAGWTLARGREALPVWNRIRALSVTSALVLAVYLAAHPASLTSPLINGSAYYGLLERGVVLAEIVLMVCMATALRRLRPAALPRNVRPAPAEHDHRLAA